MSSHQRIQLLSDHVIDHIAAGEVIERPASVVKELVENAIDAKASTIQIDIEGGGLARICVTDDGVGMHPDDVRLCWKRHATSKLHNEDDLFHIETLGFRGEALSSIAAVSEVRITTRRPEDETGFRLVLRGGQVVSEEVVGSPVGTSIDITELFFNVPARRKFLRSPATEQSHIIDTCLRSALGCRHCGLVLTTGRRRLLDIPGDLEENKRVEAALGRRVGQLYPFHYESDGIRTSGYITRPEVDRGDTRGLWLFVNGRFVRNKTIQRAILDGYRPMVERGRYPVVLTYIDIDPNRVDVNVHPQKLEVRFSDSGAIFRNVGAAFAAALGDAPWAHTGTEQLQQRTQAAVKRFFEKRENRPASFSEKRGEYHVSRSAPAAAKQTFWQDEPGVDQSRSAPISVETRTAPSEGPSGLEQIGVLWNRYILFKHDNTLLAVDQARLAQRVTYELLQSQINRGCVIQKRLLLPEIFEASGSVARDIETAGASLLQLGVEVEPIGPGRFAIRAIPEVLQGIDVVAFVKDAIGEVSQGEASAPLDDSTMERILMSASQRAAAQFEPGQGAGAGEVTRLIQQMEAVDAGDGWLDDARLVRRWTLEDFARNFAT